MKLRRIMRQRQPMPIYRLFPNMVTVLALCCGLTSVFYALNGRWEFTVAWIMAATILDGVDGRLARLLGATSNFGAQLDSLSDFVSFGVAPVLAMYMWTLHSLPKWGWAVVMLFAVCCALRLARFNTVQMEGGNKEHWREYFFSGAPAPVGANLCLLPLVAWFEFGDGLLNDPRAVACYVAAVALFMVSKVPTYSIKHIHILQRNVLPVMVFCGVTIVFFIIDTWLAYWVFGLVYLATVPAGVVHYLRCLRGISAA